MTRFRSPRHLAWLRSLPCCLTGYTEGIEAAHIRHHSGMAIKPGDDCALPLRAELHRVEHDFPGRFWFAACRMRRDEVATFAYGLGALFGDDEAGRRHLEDMHRRVDVAFIVAALTGRALDYLAEMRLNA